VDIDFVTYYFSNSGEVMHPRYTDLLSIMYTWEIMQKRNGKVHIM